MRDGHAPDQLRLAPRLVVFGVAIVLAATGLGLRLFQLQLAQASSLESVAGQVTASPFAPWRVALRRNAPHMLISMPVPDLDRIQAKQLIDILTKLSKTAQAPTQVDGS